MAGFLPEHLPLSGLDDNTSISSANRSVRRPANNDLRNPPPALVSLSKKQNTLVERQSMLFKLASTHKYDEVGKAKHRLCRTRARQFFSCDIYATSSEDDHSALSECKQLVVEAGGAIVDSFEYLGGFLFELPQGCTLPIESGDATAKGGTISVKPWQPFGMSEVQPVSLRAKENMYDGEASRPLTRGIDTFFHRKVKAFAHDGADHSHESERGCAWEHLTLREMLAERAPDRPSLAAASRDMDDTAEWETLFDGSDIDD